MSYVIGVTGGIGSGKSTATQILESFGGFRISADEIAKEVLDSDPGVREFLLSVNPQFWTESGWDRKKIALEVFRDPKLLSQFNSQIHPKIRAKTLERMKNAPSNQPIVWEVPLLFETDSHTLCQSKVFIDTKKEIAKKRAIERGMDEGDFEKRYQSQMAPDQKKALSDFVISNDTHREDLQSSLQNLWKTLQERIHSHEK